jgi:hypothetical protein
LVSIFDFFLCFFFFFFFALAAEGCEHNIHVAHVIVDGPVDMPLLRSVTGRDASELISPAEIGNMYVDIINQPATCWTKEVHVHIPAKL